MPTSPPSPVMAIFLPFTRGEKIAYHKLYDNRQLKNELTSPDSGRGEMWRQPHTLYSAKLMLINLTNRKKEVIVCQIRISDIYLQILC